MASSGRWQCQATIGVVVVAVVVGNVAVVAHVVNKLRQLSTTSAICRAKSNAKGAAASVALIGGRQRERQSKRHRAEGRLAEETTCIRLALDKGHTNACAAL